MKGVVRIHVEYYGIFRDLAKGVKKETIEVVDRNTIKLRELIDILARKYNSKIKKYVIEGFGEDIKALILVNGTYADLETTIRDGDVVSILPPASGG
ncbi:MAG TPA: MoaD/ThiS family protein [Desulfurococcales archaeon]|nr:MoaD/ThiS family protein [Desulfurococcales archaeon]